MAHTQKTSSSIPSDPCGLTTSRKTIAATILAALSIYGVFVFRIFGGDIRWITTTYTAPKASGLSSDVTTSTSYKATNTLHITKNTAYLETSILHITTAISRTATSSSRLAPNSTRVPPTSSLVATSSSRKAPTTPLVTTSSARRASKTSLVAPNSSRKAPMTSLAATKTFSGPTKTSQVTGETLYMAPETLYLTHQFTDAGLGHKFAELLFSVKEARKWGYRYCLDERTFLANARGDDYSFMLPVIYAAYPKCPPRIVPRVMTSGFYMCGQNYNENCFFSTERFYNDLPMFRLDSPHTEDTLSVHLRFGDVQANGDMNSYMKNIHHVRGLTSVPRVTFCYHTYNDDEEDLLVMLRAKFPLARFVNSESIMDTISCLTKGRMMMTSGSSLSYMIAYLCKDCVVFFSRPKEFPKVDSPYEENLKSSIYYVDRYIVLS